MNLPTCLILFDTQEAQENLLPLSFTRPLSYFRLGLLTLKEKWERFYGFQTFIMPVGFLRRKFDTSEEADLEDAYYVAGNVVPDDAFVTRLRTLKSGEGLSAGGEWIAFRGSREDFLGKTGSVNELAEDGVSIIKYVFDIFLLNSDALKNDYVRLTAGRKSAPLSDSNSVIGNYIGEDGNPTIFIEEGAKIEGAILNVKGGPIYIGEKAEVMEGSVMRGPIGICMKGKVNMGSKIYGGTTIGPYSKVGGEVNNAVIFGYSNKSHDGFLGNAVIGEWCNIGAGTNASNLKNDYSKIRVWNYHSRTFMRTNLQFCGLIMGDHSKLGINCMMNTATVLGVGVNIHGCGFPRPFVASFSEGSPTAGFTDVTLHKFFQIAERVMARRNITLTEEDKKIYERVYEVASEIKGGNRHEG